MEKENYNEEFAKWFWGKDTRRTDTETGGTYYVWEYHFDQMKLYPSPYKYIAKLLKEEEEYA